MPSKVIPLSVPHIVGNEWAYVKDCLDSGWVSSVGEYVSRFEQAVATYVNSPGAVACSSGTAALHVALRLVGVGPGDEVLMPTLTFVATANAITYLGARPVLVDVDPETLQIDLQLLEDFLERECVTRAGRVWNRETKRPVGAIVPVHVLGNMCDMAHLTTLASRYGLPVVEDAAGALGSSYGGRAAGLHGAVGCYSFNGNKIITTGNGGMIVSAREDLLVRAKYLTTQAKDDTDELVHGEVGYNYRLSNISAAMGLAQLEQLEARRARKAEIARRYDMAFDGIAGVGCIHPHSECDSNHWLYTIRVDSQAFGMSSRDLRRRLASEGIVTRPLWQPMHRSPAHSDSRCVGGAVADRLHQECLSLPCSVGLSDDDQTRVIDACARISQA